MNRPDWRQRSFPRFEVTGEVTWKTDDAGGRARLLHLSMSGLELTESDPPLLLGACLEVTLVVAGRTLGTTLAQVARLGQGSVGLRFLRLGAELRRELTGVFKSLEPLAA
jgi:hypothetical protein